MNQYYCVSRCFRDTAGTERYRSLAHSYYRGAQGVFIVYDITDLNSSFKLDDWIKDIENVSYCVIVKLIVLWFNLLFIVVINCGDNTNFKSVFYINK